MRRSAVISVALFALYALTDCKAAPSAEATAPPSTTAATPPGGVKQATVTQVTALAQKKFGASITESNTTTLASLVSEPGRYSAKTVRTEGTVSAVCQSMGCWMEIADESGQAHIKMAGHAFFIPKNANGHHAVVQGKLLNAAGPACASNDCNAGNTPNAGRGEQAQIEATGVEFID
jgi:hypothetical protein